MERSVTATDTQSQRRQSAANQTQILYTPLHNFQCSNHKSHESEHLLLNPLQPHKYRIIEQNKLQ